LHVAAQRVFTGRIWHLAGDPWTEGESALQAFERGALVVGEDGRILAVGDADAMLKQYPAAARVDFGDELILPGFVDAHLHFPQLDIIGAYGETLLGWLRRRVFPEEARLADPDRARSVARRLLDELLANGVTTAAIYSSPHREATEILFEEILARGPRAIAGKVSMDRNAPDELLADPEADARDIEELIARWHGRDGRLFVALSPRFAPSCSDALLAAHGELLRRRPDLFVQTHLAENAKEVAWVRELFPRDRDYLAVYERHNLLGPRTLLGHCIHLDDDAIARLAASRAVAVHCPTSNLFLGSGLMPLATLAGAGCRLAVGSDVGAGTSLSPWRTLAAAAQVARLRGEPLDPARLFWLATLGGAEALGLGDVTGNFAPGKQADFQVLDWRRNRLLRERFARDEPPTDLLFALIHHGDDRLTRGVWIGGREVFASKT
jgi:guanine deaminase